MLFLVIATCNISFSFANKANENIFSKMLYLIKDKIIEGLKPRIVTVTYNEHGEEIYKVDPSDAKNRTLNKDYIAPAVVFIDTFGFSNEFIDTLNKVGCVRSFDKKLFHLFPEIKLCYVRGIGTGKHNALAVAISRDKPTNNHSVYYFDIQGKEVTLLKKW